MTDILSSSDDRRQLLGRRIQFDPRSRRFPIRRLYTQGLESIQALEAVDAIGTQVWPLATFLNQGVPLVITDDEYGWDVSGCGGFSRGHALLAPPIEIPVTELYAFSLYRRGQYRDYWPETPPEQGTSVLAVVQVAQEDGHIDSYWWAFTKAELIASLIDVGPGVAGSWWTEDMFMPDDRGFIHPTGPDAGGHAYCIGGIIAELNAVVIYQTWGRWSNITDATVIETLIDAGLPAAVHDYIALIDIDELWSLLQRDGEYCVSIDRTLLPDPLDPDPQPIPDPEPTPEPEPVPDPDPVGPGDPIGWVIDWLTIAVEKLRRWWDERT